MLDFAFEKWHAWSKTFSLNNNPSAVSTFCKQHFHSTLNLQVNIFGQIQMKADIQMTLFLKFDCGIVMMILNCNWIAPSGFFCLVALQCSRKRKFWSSWRGLRNKWRQYSGHWLRSLGWIISFSEYFEQYHVRLNLFNVIMVNLFSSWPCAPFLFLVTFRLWAHNVVILIIGGSNISKWSEPGVIHYSEPVHRNRFPIEGDSRVN